MASSADILIRILGESKGFAKEVDNSKRAVGSLVKEVDKSKGALSAFGGVVQGVFQGIGQAVTGLALRAFDGLVGQIDKSTKSASNFNETVSKTRAVFRDSSKEILEWSKNSATAFGLSREAALGAASTLGNMFLQLGAGSDDASKLSRDMIALAADITSFHNVAGGTPEVLNAIQSAFRGEYDALQRYIPTINAATVEQLALADTGKATAKQLTALDKALAAQTLIMNGAGAAVGAYARELDSTASQQRIFEANTQNISSQIGQMFVPIQVAFFRGVNDLIANNAKWGEQVLVSFAHGLARGISALTPALVMVKDVISYWLESHSPPRLLPDLTKWGQGALAAYLQGWTEGDFSVLRGLGDSIEGILRSFVGAGQIKETDLVGRVFGSRNAILRAIDEWKRAGSVSADSLDAIRRAAGPAGDSVAGLVDAYFDLQQASQRAAQSQEQLNSVTRQYDSRLSPLQDKLNDLQARQQKIRDNQRLLELGEIVNDPTADVSDRGLARLEQDEIRLRQRMAAVENERDVALEAEQKKLAAAQKEQEASSNRLDQQQAILDQQVKANALTTEQIALENHLAEERKAAAEKAKHAAEQLSSAMLAYQLSITDTAGKIAILRGELGKLAPGTSEYFQSLEQLAGLEKQLGDERVREAEKLADSQLNYELALADTAGQIAIWREELSKVAVGSSEYYDILTKIAGLQDKVGIGAGVSGLPGIDTASITAAEEASSAYSEVTRAIKEMFAALEGPQPIQGPAVDPGPFGISIKNGSPVTDHIKVKEVSEDVKNFVDNIKALTDAVTGVTGPLETLAALFGPVATESELAAATTETAADDIVLSFQNAAKTLTGVFNLDWKGALDGLVGIVGQALLGIAGKLPGADGSEPSDTSSPIHGIRAMGVGFYTLMAAGMLLGQGPLVRGYLGFLQWLRDQLPGSEPKDTTSPLYGLSDAGESLLGNIWDGLKTKWTEFSEWWTEKMGWILDQIPALPSWLGGSSLAPSLDAGGYGSGGSFGASSSLAPMASASGFAPTTSSTTTNTNLGGVHLVFQGPVTQETIRTAVRTADDELRARGFK